MQDSLLEELKDRLIPKLIPYPYDELAELVGVECLSKLAKRFGGTKIYIPKTDTIVRNLRDELIKQEFNGFNRKELAQKYHLSENWIQEICKNG